MRETPPLMWMMPKRTLTWTKKSLHCWSQTDACIYLFIGNFEAFILLHFTYFIAVGM